MKRILVIRALVISSLVAVCSQAHPVHAGAKTELTTGPWNLANLQKPVKILEVVSEQNPQAVYYAGEPYMGKSTRVFGYLGIPENTTGKLPAMVLVHGGGGTAFKEWAELWAKRGYVCLAMDLAGHGPNRVKLADGSPDQKNPYRFEAKNTKDFWSYHAVANVIRGVSLLANHPRVDPDRIGITGISWGGYLTCIVAGLDDRLKVAVPVYGCGFLGDNSAWVPIFDKMSPMQRKHWLGTFDPSVYVGQAQMPLLFVNGTNDFAYPLDSYQKTYRKVKNRNLCVTVRMPHSHPAGWAPVEIGLFVDQHLKQATPLPTLTDNKRTGTEIEAAFQSKTPIKHASLHFTRDTGPWQKRKWQSQPAKVEGNKVVGTLPDTRAPLVYFLTITDNRNATISTEHESLAKPK